MSSICLDVLEPNFELSEGIFESSKCFFENGICYKVSFSKGREQTKQKPEIDILRKLFLNLF
jgi:hypothetical protein